MCGYVHLLHVFTAGGEDGNDVLSRRPTTTVAQRHSSLSISRCPRVTVQRVHEDEREWYGVALMHEARDNANGRWARQVEMTSLGQNRASAKATESICGVMEIMNDYGQILQRGLILDRLVEAVLDAGWMSQDRSCRRRARLQEHGAGVLHAVEITRTPRAR
ncbi:hypothetical protein B0H17DRAFT_1125716 [Mycena rosella]|uniref:Uncharacterized protein n=1 Tax=Mycena rosella TaxID=1033263 RepID=A0AAD7GWT1_MYCRO|nr:hypothetical protein B0H17DRAFT_1125716 [Mycena rosella]